MEAGLQGAERRLIRKVALGTLGCKVNQAESIAWQSAVLEAGSDIVPFGQPADLYILNTCTVTHLADRKSRQLVRQASRGGGNPLVVVTGCYAEMDRDAVSQLPGVTKVLGTADKDALLDRLRELGVEFPVGRRELEDSLTPDYPAPPPANRVRAFVKVQDGCDDYCTYCIIPFARGHSRSRDPQDLVAQVQSLHRQGFQEVVLTGVQLGAYGRDRVLRRGQPMPPPGEALARLVERILSETEIPRLRLSSLQPQDWPAEFLDLWNSRRLCRHLHLPLQSGSDSVLRRMARRYATEQFASLVTALRQKIPGMAISADVMVGFPGETEAEHKESLEFVERMAFSRLHVFRFSPRRGTAAARMAGQIPDIVKQQRVADMISLGQRSAEAFRRQFLGQCLPVLWEERESPGERLSGGLWRGLTDNYLRVYALSEADLLGIICPAQLVGLLGDGLEGIVQGETGKAAA